MKILTYTTILIVVLFLAKTTNILAQDKNSKPIIYNKYTFTANVKSPDDVKNMEEFLLKKESIFVIKVDFSKKTAMVICNELIGEKEIYQLCNKVNIKTDNYKAEQIEESEIKSIKKK